MNFKKKIECIRCADRGITKKAEVIITFNTYKLPFCKHHKKDFIESLHKDNSKVNDFTNITFIK